MSIKRLLLVSFLIVRLTNFAQTGPVELLEKNYFKVLPLLEKDNSNISDIEEHTIKETTRYISYIDKLAKVRVHLMFENNISYAACLFYDSSSLAVIVALLDKSFVKTSDLEWVNYDKQNIYYKITDLNQTFMLSISKNKL